MMLKPLENIETQTLFIKFLNECYKHQLFDDMHHFKCTGSTVKFEGYLKVYKFPVSTTNL